MIYKIRNLSDSGVVKSAYFSLFQSHVGYGLAAWGTSRHCLDKIFLTQKRAIRATASLNFDDPTSDSFKKFGILKIHDLMKVHFASLMWDFDHGSLPHVFQGFFIKISDIHSYHTRSSASDDLAKKNCAKTIHGSKLFKIISVELNELLISCFNPPLQNKLLYYNTQEFY